MAENIFNRRLRGFRVVELAALAVLVVLAFAVYAFKTFAGAQNADAVKLERQIAFEQKRIRLLNAEIAYLENPRRIERLSTSYLNLAPVSAAQETTVRDAANLAAQAKKP